MKPNLVVDLIEKLNYELYSIDEDLVINNGICFEYVSSGTVDIINFLGITIWNSEDDDRIFCNVINKYEPLDEYVRRKTNELLNRISNIHL